MSQSTAPKWYIGILLLIVAIAFLLFGAFPMQMNWGMYGLALTQIGLLLIALAAPWLCKWKLKEVMPIKKVTGKHFFGTLILYCATFIVVNTVTMIIAYFFPGMLEVSSALGSFFVTVPFFVALIIVAVLPGICEEVLFRGVILHTMRKFKSQLAVMLIVAVIFGLFHLDVYRFLPTAIIGFVLTYLMIKTENFLLPVFYHFLNNAVSLSAGYSAFSNSAEVEATAEIGLEFIGVYLILATLTPGLYYFAGRLLNPERKNKKDKFVAIALAVLLFVLGMGIFAHSIDTGVTIMSFTQGESVDNNTQPVMHDVVVDKAGIYELFVGVEHEAGVIITEANFMDQTGLSIFNPDSGTEFNANKGPVYLEKGIYMIEFNFDGGTSEPVDVQFAFTLRRIGGF
ncbi:MAG: CPBP family intramembrane metalloprotease [Lachnospiraceae bacterium]|nr:CPBP family intramembrane metalloprotease [Lachnospiraceae bacterium]